MFKTKSINSVMKTFTKVVSDLREVSAQHDATAEALREKARKLEADADVARSDAFENRADAARAANIADTIEQQFSLGN